jgi:DNA-binding Xre family transcriptional regulator
MKNNESKFLYVLKRETVSSQISTQNLKKWWLAEAVGVHKTTLRRWLNGEIQRINGSNLRKLSVVLETPSYELVDLSPLTATLG